MVLEEQRALGLRAAEARRPQFHGVVSDGGRCRHVLRRVQRAAIQGAHLCEFHCAQLHRVIAGRIATARQSEIRLQQVDTELEQVIAAVQREFLAQLQAVFPFIEDKTRITQQCDRQAIRAIHRHLRAGSPERPAVVPDESREGEAGLGGECTGVINGRHCGQGGFSILHGTR